MKNIRIILAAALLLVLVCTGAIAENSEPLETVQPAVNVQTEETVGLPWNLILVNATHAVPELGDLEGVELRNGQMVDRRIYPDLQKMFDDCRAAGGSIRVNTSFRTLGDQERMVNEKFDKYKNMGHTDEEAWELAYAVAAKPGYSEHHTGLAVDIVSDNHEVCTNDNLWAWLAEHCAEYGFILRYPEDKTHITGISYEPWHFRYVGHEAAKTIMSENLTLEEYLEIYYNYT